MNTTRTCVVCLKTFDYDDITVEAIPVFLDRREAENATFWDVYGDEERWWVHFKCLGKWGLTVTTVNGKFLKGDVVAIEEE